MENFHLTIFFQFRMLHLSEQLSTEDVHRIAYLFYMAFFSFLFSIQYSSIVTNRALSNLCITYLYDLVVSVIEFVYFFVLYRNEDNTIRENVKI